MIKPNNYDATQARNEFIPVELGGHKLIIKQVSEKQSSTGKPMIVVMFDFAPDDAQAGYFMEQYKNDIRPDKKWPNAGTQYILTLDSADASKVSRSFKGFITSVERSNGFEVEWGDKFCEQFKNKKVGGVFGLVEEEYNGEIKKRHKLRWFCEDDRADSAAIPADKLLNGVKSSGKPTDAIANNIPADAPEEIPF